MDSNDIVIPYDEIVKRAYYKYLHRGCVDGYSEQDWLEAEAELKAEYNEIIPGVI